MSWCLGQTPIPPKLHGCFSAGSHAQKMTSVLDIKKKARNCNDANFGMSQKRLVAKIYKIDPKLVPIINKKWK